MPRSPRLIEKYAEDAAYNIAYVWPGAARPTARSSGSTRRSTQQDPGLSEIATEPLFANLHDDPRWLPFLRKIGKAPEQLAAIKFDVKLPQ